MHFDSELSAFNLETQNYDDNDEAAANSIINVKNLKILFANKYNNFEDFKKYLYGVILPYITQLIPSTTILNVEFEGVEASAVVDYTFAGIAGIVK
jgi:p-aminobenzoyl-glutamate transporter AbgT